MNDTNDVTDDPLADFTKRSRQTQKRFYARKPKTAKEVMALVMNGRGYGRVLSMEHYELALCATIGDALAPFVKVVGLRRGCLDIVVDNSVVMQELTFLRQQVLEALAAALPDEDIKDLRFRIGPVGATNSVVPGTPRSNRS